MARPTSILLLLLLLAGLGLGAPARALEIAGVAVPDALVVGGRSLQLNGAGLRSRLFVKVYVGALYLEQRSPDARVILGADAPWAVTLVFRRDVDHEKILDAFVAAFEQNSPGQLEQLRPQLEIFHGVLRDLRAGESLTLHYLPGAGTTLTVPGGGMALVPGRPFAEAVLRTWLGEHPTDGSLKQALLGL
jgi:hypothetical protein